MYFFFFVELLLLEVVYVGLRSRLGRGGEAEVASEEDRTGSCLFLYKTKQKRVKCHYV